jgi:ubiquinone biosynthesis protein
MAEGIGERLDPTFQLNAVIAPYADRLVLRLLSPRRVLKKLGQAGVDAARLGVEIPQQVRHILGDIERGGFEIGLKTGALDPLIARLELLSNRIVLGVIAAAFVVGLAVLLSVYHPPGWERWAGKMFVVGFFLAAAIAIYLSWSILRSSRRKGG